MSSIWKVEIVFDNKRIKKTKRHFDELCEDERLTELENCSFSSKCILRMLGYCYQ